jgi:hypothetical protein
MRVEALFRGEPMLADGILLNDRGETRCFFASQIQSVRSISDCMSMEVGYEELASCVVENIWTSPVSGVLDFYSHISGDQLLSLSAEHDDTFEYPVFTDGTAEGSEMDLKSGVCIRSLHVMASSVKA